MLTPAQKSLASPQGGNAQDCKPQYHLMHQDIVRHGYQSAKHLPL